MIRFVFVRHEGSPASMTEGRWCLDVTSRAKPVLFVRCPDCGGLDEIDVALIDKGGATDEPFFCQCATCNFCRFVRLEGWEPGAFDRSEVLA